MLLNLLCAIIKAYISTIYTLRWFCMHLTISHLGKATAALNLQGTKNNILLCTISQEMVAESQILTDLDVSKLNNQSIDLPKTFTQETISVSKN